MFAGGDPAASAGVYDLTRKVHGLPGATVPLDVDEYPTPPAGLELEQVRVYVRHGTVLALTFATSCSPAMAHRRAHARARADGGRPRGHPGAVGPMQDRAPVSCRGDEQHERERDARGGHRAQGRRGCGRGRRLWRVVSTQSLRALRIP